MSILEPPVCGTGEAAGLLGRFFKKVEFDPGASANALRIRPRDEIADAYESGVDDVKAAVAYEEQFRSLAV